MHGSPSFSAVAEKDGEFVLVRRFLSKRFQQLLRWKRLRLPFSADKHAIAKRHENGEQFLRSIAELVQFEDAARVAVRGFRLARYSTDQRVLSAIKSPPLRMRPTALWKASGYWCLSTSQKMMSNSPGALSSNSSASPT